MVHAVLLVEGSNGLRTRPLAARGMHALVGEIVIDVAENGFDQIAAVIDFGDDAVCTVCRVALNHPLRCIVGAVLAAEIVDHIEVGRPGLAIGIQSYAHDQNPHSAESSLLVTAGSVPTTMRVSGGHRP